MKQLFSINPNILQRYGMNKGLLLQEIHYSFVNKTKPNEFYMSVPFVYCTANSFLIKFPFMKRQNIQRYLNEFVEDCIVFSTVANKNNHDRTKSYLLNIEKYNSIINNVKYSESKGKDFIKYCNCIYD